MDTYLGEIRLFPYDRIPTADGWKICNGQALNMQQNMALYSLIGSQFGGDDKTYFNLPNLNGRVIVGFGRSPVSGNIYYVGKSGGESMVNLDSKTAHSHKHYMMVHNSYDTALPGTNILGNACIPTSSSQAKKNTANSASYVTSTPDPRKLTVLNSSSISIEGGGQAHENRMPFVTMAYCMATQGVYPSRP